MLLTVISTNLRKCESHDAVIVGEGPAGVETGVVLENVSCCEPDMRDRRS